MTEHTARIWESPSQDGRRAGWVGLLEGEQEEGHRRCQSLGRQAPQEDLGAAQPLPAAQGGGRPQRGSGLHPSWGGRREEHPQVQ